MSKKLISVIIPVYNQELFLGRCLRSILSQSINREDFEIIVIDDGSKDGSLKIIQSFGNEII
jgi:glycosyltransferase involved in cell wall biosynthesis